MVGTATLPSRRTAVVAALGLSASNLALLALASEVTPSGLADRDETLQWIDANPDPLAFAEVLSTYNINFCTYLARFLLNFDPSARAWWDSKVGRFELDSTRARAAKLALFAKFAASVQYGLRVYTGSEGVGSLFDALVRVHGAFPERRRHLALAFTFLEAAQPRERIAGLLRAGDGTPIQRPAHRAEQHAPAGLAPFTAPFSPALPDYLAQDPLFLLPPTQVPVWDVNLRRYCVLGLGEVRALGRYSQEGYADGSSGGQDGSLLSVFGPRAKFSVQRERALTPSDYALFALSGAAGCCATHALVTPLDVVKTRLQTSGPQSGSLGLVAGLRTIVAEEGWPMLFSGLQATLAGYSWYGMTVYPGYEFFSRYFEQLAGPAAVSQHSLIVLGSGACATVIACVGVCPMEAARIRAVAQPDFAPGLVPMLRRLIAEEGLGSLYLGFGPVVLRQVMFGMVKFGTFDSLTDTLFVALPSLKATVGTQLLVTLIAGLAAGIASACVSQPADAILSEINRQGDRRSVGSAAASLWNAGGGGPSRFFVGLGSRCVWSGSIISGQFFIYDIVRAIFGISSDDLLLFLDVQFKDLQL